MPVTIDPAVEACQAIVARINSGTAYTLGREAQYAENVTTELDKIVDLEVDVVPSEPTQLDRLLDPEDMTSHTITIWIRKKTGADQAVIDLMRLFVRQVYQRVNNYDSADRRVRVWEISDWTQSAPDKDLLRRLGLFSASIVLRVEVGASP